VRAHWFDSELGDMEAALQQAFGDRLALLTSWDRARSKFIVFVEGVDAGAEYYLFNSTTNQADSLGVAYPELAPFGALARREPMSYPARDGVSIPAYLTTPPNASGPLPLIVMPHGGPEVRDVGGYDWMAHLFASRGYLVLQPNFRGSIGYGLEFRNAGRGEWGGLMQDDVTDGVQHLIDAGLADPERVCIVGWSYGGYSALSGAVKTPDLYACVVAIAPVADLPDQIRYAKDRYGTRNWVVSYWTNVIGDVREDNAQLVAASPARQAESVRAPVLLVHGAEDTVVPIDQSEEMRSALRRADRDVELLRLSGDDHELYRPATRLEAMQAVVAFLEEHLGE
jgi:dipeptidyl aminopeptidase/acylaminoacyl peptidase